MTEWRALCEELAEDVRYLSECLRDPDSGVDPVCLSGALPIPYSALLLPSGEVEA